MILVILGAVAIGTTGIAKNKDGMIESSVGPQDGMAFHPVFEDR